VVSVPSDTEPGGGAAPARWRVLLLNDNDTPMEFVVYLLQELFAMNFDDAKHFMMHVHHNGVGECGVYAEDEAKAKVAAVLALAREHDHPLRCILEQKRSA
jgi:ATP-dependent Clp protease adaptor protein ClpS